MNANPADTDKFAAFLPLALKAMKHTVVSFWCVGEGARREKDPFARSRPYSSSLTTVRPQMESLRSIRSGAPRAKRAQQN